MEESSYQSRTILHVTLTYRAEISSHINQNCVDEEDRGFLNPNALENLSLQVNNANILKPAEIK